MPDELRICVTGLSRAGKTAFITALVDALKNAHLARDSFLGWSAVAEGRYRGARILPPTGAVGSLEAFRYEDNRRALTARPPVWPAATDSVRALRLQTSCAVQPGVFERVLDGMTRRTGAVKLRHTDITIVDYPGEWALDLPLRAMDFSAWSERTVGLAQGGVRHAVSGPFLELIARIDPMGQFSEGRARDVHAAYVAYLDACRDKLRLSYLQPGLFLRPEKIGGRNALMENETFRFFPLPCGDVRKVIPGSWRDVLSRRYEAYKRDYVEGFFGSLKGPGETRQVVLFDLLAALSGGREAYEDAREALGEIARAMRPKVGFFGRLFGSSLKVLYAATKADYVPAQSRRRIERHIEAIVSGLQLGAAEKEVSRTLTLASIAATRSGVDAQDRPVVVGSVRDRHTGEIRPEQIFRFPPPPVGTPTEADWEAWEKAGVVGYLLPEFLPDAEDLRARPDIPQLNLDAAVEFLVSGHV
jgi:predicted YcjX-like family ATPase